MTQEGEKPEEIYKAEGYIYHVHIAENENRTAPGVKRDDFRPYLTALKDINYTGNISVECRWGDDFYKELSGCFSELNMQLEAVNQ